MTEPPFSVVMLSAYVGKWQLELNRRCGACRLGAWVSAEGQISVARRGLLAELQHQAKVSQQKSARAAQQRSRELVAAEKAAEQARRAEERATAQAGRAAAADLKRLEKELKAAHIASKEAAVAQRNARLAAIYDEIDNLLASTLDVDDYVDLDNLRRTVEHPPFDRSDLEVPVPQPPAIPEPPAPVVSPPAAPKGILGRKKKAEEARAAAELDLQRATTAWEAEVASLPERRERAEAEHARAESERLAELETARTRYQEECAVREGEVAEHNAAVDSLINNLAYGVADAVEEYVGIVLANSVYPEHFEVQHEYSFEPAAAELRLRCLVPGPSTLPAIKAYRYVKASDEIAETALSQKAMKDRYAGAVHHVALRTLHEVFEADRRAVIQAISLEVGSETIDPATGNATYIPMVAVAADRETFVSFDLSAVVPLATLEFLGAAVSKNPWGLVPADGKGVRKL